MYSNFDDVLDLFFIAASKEQISQRSSHDCSKVIRHEARKGEEQPADLGRHNPFSHSAGRPGICGMESVQH
jgi:hypothetical protein